MSTYNELSTQLENIMSDLQTGNLDLDDAIEKYKHGIKIIKQLEGQLKNAENKITKIKDSLND